ncbi:hypothetical protein KbCgl_05170 [Corynebacterium glutamicum]|nr:hypothetical protein KbCgl_05170 [Corynebacterium glutamicum]
MIVKENPGVATPGAPNDLNGSDCNDTTSVSQDYSATARKTAVEAAKRGWSSEILREGVRGDGAAFQVLSRRRHRSEKISFTDESDDSESHDDSESSCDSTTSERDVCACQSVDNSVWSQAPMGNPILRPCDCSVTELETDDDDAVASLAVADSSRFGDLASMKAMGTGRKGLIVGFDTEFFSIGGEKGRREILSYQFAVVDVHDPEVMVEVVILPLEGERISMHVALWKVVEVAGLWESDLVPEVVTSKGVCLRDFWTLEDEMEFDERYSDAHPDRTENLRFERNEALLKSRARVPITLVSHFGAADLSAFKQSRYLVDHMRNLTSAAGGLVTLMPFKLIRSDHSRWWWQWMTVDIRDTMAHAPAGQQSLGALGLACGVQKLKVDDFMKSHMDIYKRDHLLDFLEYGINDSVIVVEYFARMWGDSIVPPITLGGGAARAMVASGIDYLRLSSSKEFRRIFSGLVSEDQGLDAVEEGDKLSFYAKRRRAPVDGSANQFMAAFAAAYHGGLNSCPSPGYYTTRTIDVDAQNAYPTAMACIEDVDFEAGCIDEVIHERELTLDDVSSPVSPVVAFVSFEFPNEVKYPCIPVSADNTLIYSRSSEGIAGTWVTGPELWLALKMGAKITAQIGYRGRLLSGPDDGRSLTLRHGVRSLIDDRNRAKEIYGKGSLEEKTLKTAVVSIYGKTAQDVSERRSWNAKGQEMDAVGGSAITSPYHAAMTTSLVRAQLHATMQQLHDHGHKVYSVTTDGFITDASLDDVEGLDLFGLADHLREARQFLVGDSSMWEVKHEQETFLNFVTRGNVSLDDEGVCAHAGLKFDLEEGEEDSAKDRELLLETVVTREGRVQNNYVGLSTFKELSRVERREDFGAREVNRTVSLDYDLKRRPDMATMKPVMVKTKDDSEWEVANFDTNPWDRVEDALRGRMIARTIAETGCLRTVAEWKEWEVKNTHGKGRRIVTPKRAILMSIVIAHRTGVVLIPTLADSSLTVAQRLEWLSEWGLGTLSRGDWDNARRPERASQMFPLDVLEPFLTRMREMSVGDHPTEDDCLPYNLSGAV